MVHLPPTLSCRVDSLTDSLSSGRDGVQIIQNLAQQGIELLDTVIQQNTVTGEEVESFLDNVNQICPNYQDSLCDDLSNTSKCNLGKVIGSENIGILQAVLDHFADGQQSLYYQEMIKLRENLEDLVVMAETVDDKAANFNWAFYCAMAFSLALSLICIYMMVGEIFRISKVLQNLRSWFVMPVFVIFVTCSLVFSSLFIIWSMALADLCVDGPDARMLAILNRFRDELSPILVESAAFYISRKYVAAHACSIIMIAPVCMIVELMSLWHFVKRLPGRSDPE
jgi:hypothetical protein